MPRRFYVLIVLLCCAEVGDSPRLQAQQFDSPNAIQMQAEVKALNENVKTLLREQQEIVDKMAELNRRLPNSVPEPTKENATLDVHGLKFRGDNAARVAIVEYADFECPYCELYEQKVSPQMLKSYVSNGKIKIFFRDLPLPTHEHAELASRAALCAGSQDKYWEMHDKLFANQQDLSEGSLHDRAVALGLNTSKFDECLSSDSYTDEIRKSSAEAQALGVMGTPTFFIGTISSDGNVVTVNKRIAGARSYEFFKSALDGVLAAESNQTSKSN
jgi:protein-disulfide isomerase